MPKHLARLRLIAPFLLLVLVGAGCGTTTAPTGPDGGVWKSADSGQTWTNEKSFVSGAHVSTGAATLDIASMTFDPQDHNTIYLGTRTNGLLYSLDGGSSWQQPLFSDPSKAVLVSGSVSAVAVDPKQKCTVYAASANKIYETQDCGRDWMQVFFDPRTDKSFTQIAVDWYNPTILYAGTDDGDIFRSTDSGNSWQTAERVDGMAITDIKLDTADSRTVYVGTQGSGIWKTADGGDTWTQIEKQFGDDFRDARTVTQIVLDPVDPNTLYVVSKYGIIKSTDAGNTWTGLNLTSPPETVKINSLAIDPKDNKHLIYTGISTLQYSTDGGVSWTPKKLPTTQDGSVLLFDPIDSSVIYLGTTPHTKSNQ